MYISARCRRMRAKSSLSVWCALEWKQKKEQKHSPANTTNITGGEKNKSINIRLWRPPTSLARLKRCRWAGVWTQTNATALCLNLMWPQRSCTFQRCPLSCSRHLSCTQGHEVPEPDPAVTGPRTGCQLTERQTAVCNHHHTHCSELAISPVCPPSVRSGS